MATHETFIEHSAVKPGSDRGFGLTVGGILTAIGGARWLFGDQPGPDVWTLAILVIGGSLVVLALVAAATLSSLNRAWTKLGLVLFKFVSPVVLFLVFAFSVVPTALVMRALGHDLLRLRRDVAASSYWIERMPPGPAPDRMRNQF